MNRISSAQEKKGAVSQWKQTFLYDQYGNRRFDTSNGNTTPGMEGTNPSISTANNRISKAGYEYDAVGNMSRNEVGHTYAYDAENRMVSFGSPSPATYAYDGSGQRVKKVVGTGTLAVKTTFVYDAGGKLVAEYTTTTGQASEVGTRYVTQDMLGSSRVVTDEAKKVKARYDYLPYGEEISSSYGSRSSVAGYTPSDLVRQKYTGYERDTETGLDFAQARYYANQQGRFISADSVAGSALNPQTLNRYAYTGNNPLNNIDPSGHVFFGAQFNSSQSYGNESGAGYPDYAEAGLSDEGLWKYLGIRQAIDAQAAQKKRQHKQQQHHQQQRHRTVLIVGGPGIRQNAGRNFQRAAETRQAELERRGQEAFIVPATTEADFSAALTNNGMLDGVEYFGHAGSDALFIGDGWSDQVTLDSSELSQLSNDNLNAGATIILHGCDTAVGGQNSIAAKMSVQLERTTFGYDQKSEFSTNPDRPTGARYHPETGPTYMVPIGGGGMQALKGFSGALRPTLPYE